MSIYIACPHCECLIEIVQINCGIFRHGVFKETNLQLDPHSSEIVCKEAIENGKIYGCGKPFKLEFQDDEYIPTICEYI